MMPLNLRRYKLMLPSVLIIMAPNWFPSIYNHSFDKADGMWMQKRFYYTVILL